MAVGIDQGHISAAGSTVAVGESTRSSGPVDGAVADAAAAAQVSDPVAHVLALGRAARAASTELATADTGLRNTALLQAAEVIDARADAILSANAQDMASARERELAPALLDRLELTEARIASMSGGLRDIAAQSDPVGSLSATEQRPSGLQIARMRVPIGVIGVIYESRPNVTADAAGICLKSGNAVILRGGSEAARSNQIIHECIVTGVLGTGLPASCVQRVETTDRAAVGALLAMNDYVDVVIPRGGKGLVARIASDAKVPVIKHLDGICHVYVDQHADLARAVDVAVDAKTYRYGICGSMETLLVHASVAAHFLPLAGKAFNAKGVELRACARSRDVLREAGLASVPATEDDWGMEYLGPILAVRIVDSLDEAMAHIAMHGSGHTDAIVTDHIGCAKEFTRRVDSSSVMVNAATCFADGAEYGLGAEIGISTDRLHVRGPVGVLGLTTEKYVVTGDYTTRGA